LAAGCPDLREGRAPGAAAAIDAEARLVRRVSVHTRLIPVVPTAVAVSPLGAAIRWRRGRRRWGTTVLSLYTREGANQRRRP